MKGRLRAGALVLANGGLRNAASGAAVQDGHAGLSRGAHRARLFEGASHALAKFRFAWSGEAGGTFPFVAGSGLARFASFGHVGISFSRYGSASGALSAILRFWEVLGLECATLVHELNHTVANRDHDLSVGLLANHLLRDQ